MRRTRKGGKEEGEEGEEEEEEERVAVGFCADDYVIWSLSEGVEVSGGDR